MHRFTGSITRRTTSVAYVAAIAGALAIASIPVRAQSAEHDAASRIVARLFDAMRARDTAAMRAAFVPNASMQTLTPNGVRFGTIDGWINGIGRAPAGLLLDEQLANAVVHVDGDLANVWVDYWFFAGERLSHCGVDAVLLARQNGTWRIFSLVDTRRAQDCGSAPRKSPS